MKKFLFIWILVSLTPAVSAQKSRVVSAVQMIEKEKYEDAKEAIELAVWNDKTSSWARTYFVRGLLCQTAFEDGFDKREVKKTSLYPDQLYLAYSSYERALELDHRKRLHDNISQKYYSLSNDFRLLGERYFKSGDFDKAFRAFEHALLVNSSNLIQAEIDSSLIYNTALAAFESQNWDKTIAYLGGLHEDGHAPATSLLLYNAFLASGDTVKAEEVLMEGLGIYDYDTQPVLYLVNLLSLSGREDQALKILDRAIFERPENHRFYWAKALILSDLGQSELAIESFESAIELAPEESKIYFHLGIVYYNLGVDLSEQSLKVSDIDKYLELKGSARDQYEKAVFWLEKSYEMDPYDDEVVSKLYVLYNQLHMDEKEKALRPLLE